MITRRFLAVLPLVALATTLAACGGSDHATNAPAPSPTKPAHDLRINSELEKFVTDEWNKNFSDKANGNYQEGVTVKQVACAPETGTSRSKCSVTASTNQAKDWWYVVSPDGSSAERAEQQG